MSVQVLTSRPDLPEPLPSGLVDRLAEALYADQLRSMPRYQFADSTPDVQEAYRREVRVVLRALAADDAMQLTYRPEPGDEWYIGWTECLTEIKEQADG